jgi:hypothetical protein
VTHTPGPITVSAGDEGGPLTNGGMHTGAIPAGDLDVWTIHATAGNSIAALLEEITDTGSFSPWVRVWRPDGTVLGSSFGNASANVEGLATVTGTYLVLVASGDSINAGTGTYRLTVTSTPGVSFNAVDPPDGGAIRHTPRGLLVLAAHEPRSRARLVGGAT